MQLACLSVALVSQFGIPLCNKRFEIQVVVCKPRRALELLHVIDKNYFGIAGSAFALRFVGGRALGGLVSAPFMPLFAVAGIGHAVARSGLRTCTPRSGAMVCALDGGLGVMGRCLGGGPSDRHPLRAVLECICCCAQRGVYAGGCVVQHRR